MAMMGCLPENELDVQDEGSVRTDEIADHAFPAIRKFFEVAPGRRGLELGAMWYDALGLVGSS